MICSRTATLSHAWAQQGFREKKEDKREIEGMRLGKSKTKLQYRSKVK